MGVESPSVRLGFFVLLQARFLRDHYFLLMTIIGSIVFSYPRLNSQRSKTMFCLIGRKRVVLRFEFTILCVLRQSAGFVFVVKVNVSSRCVQLVAPRSRESSHSPDIFSVAVSQRPSTSIVIQKQSNFSFYCLDFVPLSISP